MANKLDVLTRWQLLRPYLDRRERSLWAAAEAEAIGYGGSAMLTDVTGISAPTILARVREIRLTKAASAGSLVDAVSYGRGRGRKLVEVKDPDIEPALERMQLQEVCGLWECGRDV